MRFKLDENLPASAGAKLAEAGHDVDTVLEEDLGGLPDPDVVVASTAAERRLISLDRGPGDSRAYPRAPMQGIIVLRLDDQSAATVTKAIGDLAAVADLDKLAGAVRPKAISADMKQI